MRRFRRRKRFVGDSVRTGEQFDATGFNQREVEAEVEPAVGSERDAEVVVEGGVGDGVIGR